MAIQEDSFYSNTLTFALHYKCPLKINDKTTSWTIEGQFTFGLFATFKGSWIDV